MMADGQRTMVTTAIFPAALLGMVIMLSAQQAVAVTASACASAVVGSPTAQAIFQAPETSPGPIVVSNLPAQSNGTGNCSTTGKASLTSEVADPTGAAITTGVSMVAGTVSASSAAISGGLQLTGNGSINESANYTFVSADDPGLLLPAGIESQFNSGSGSTQTFQLEAGEVVNYTYTATVTGVVWNPNVGSPLSESPRYSMTLSQLGGSQVANFSFNTNTFPNGGPSNTYSESFSGTLTNSTGTPQSYVLNSSTTLGMTLAGGYLGPQGTTGNFGGTSSYAYTLALTDAIAPQPVISSWSPTSGPVGTVITVKGSGLAGLKSAWVGAAHDAAIQSDTAGSVQIVVPADAATGQLALGNGNSWVFSGGTFTVTDASGPLSISSWSPTSGPVGTVITVNGTGLNGLKSVWIGAGHDASIQSDTPTSVQIVVPADASTSQLALGNGSTWVFTSGVFTVTAAVPLAITSWSPTVGPPGTVITIKGTGLSGLKSAWIGAGHDAAIQNDTADSVEIVVPKDASSGQIALGNGSTWEFTSGSFTVN